jgi:hypothetical protein
MLRSPRGERAGRETGAGLRAGVQPGRDCLPGGVGHGRRKNRRERELTMPTVERNRCERCTIGDCMRRALSEDRVRADGHGKWWVIDRPGKYGKGSHVKRK